MLGPLAFALAGCASPGPPLPPTLNLPAIPVASSLTAERIGAAVIVHWTTPHRTTDRLPIKGPVTAEICREVVSADAAPPGNAAIGAAPCVNVVAKVPAALDSVGEATDVLPRALASGPPRLLVYRVQLKNAAERTAGASAAVYAAAGDAPQPLDGFRGRNTHAGVVLEWTPAQDTSVRVELTRTDLAPPAEKQKQQPASISGALERQGRSQQVRLQVGGAGAADAGGTIDRTTELGHTYRYIAWRVRTVQAGGRQLDIRSAPSVTAEVAVEDIFAPDAPRGLVAVPGVAGQGAAAHAAIDLSWEPNDEPRIAGYRVYRRVAGGAASDWKQIGGGLVATPAYSDGTVTAGERYGYRVTAVGMNGRESGPGNEVEETASAP